MHKKQAERTVCEQDGACSVLSTAEMAEADRLAIVGGPFDGYGLMRNAGQAIVREVLARFPQAGRVAVLCGPGNNGGDGYVVARLLAEDGVGVRLYASGSPRAGSDAALAAHDCPVAPEPLDVVDPAGFDLVVDAIFGAGLAKPLTGVIAEAIDKVKDSGVPVVAIDLPSGVSGDSGAVLGTSLRAVLTVTFFRKKPGHLLYPGRELCGEIVVADIGIGASVLSEIKPETFENDPVLWRASLPRYETDTHKYARGAVAVFSGGPAATGAARLAAHAAARAGAGAVTVLSPPSALLVNAMHLTSIMVRKIDGADDADAFFSEGKTAAAVIGPGFGVGEAARAQVLQLLETGADHGLKGVVLDADALTSFADCATDLFDAVGQSGLQVVMTPHEGEYRRLFPEWAADASLCRLSRARLAADASGAVAVLKGPDTVIAAPDGRAAINTNGTPVLATAGSGDVLAGLAGGLLAQGMAGFDAACAAVWVHAGAGQRAGFGAMAEDIVDEARHVLGGLLSAQDG